MKENKKKVLLTGCAGFIGSNFVKSVCSRKEIADQYDFLIIDALTYAGRKQTIDEDLKKSTHLSFQQIDIRDVEKIKKLFSENVFSGVIHFAAESHVDRSIDNPNIFAETNVFGTMNLLNEAIKMQKLIHDFKFVHVSTDEVYGSLNDIEPAFTENHPICPNSPYSASKAGSDLMVRAYHETYKLNTCITRCSNNYGPYQFPEKLIPRMIEFALKDKKLPVYGSGLNIRDWIYVEDHNEGVWRVFKDGHAGHVYNLGGNSERKNIDVIKAILNYLGKPETLIEYVEDRKGHDWRYAINFSKAKNELNWQPKLNFEEGIKKTVQWYLDNQDWLAMIYKTGI